MVRFQCMNSSYCFRKLKIESKQVLGAFNNKAMQKKRKKISKKENLVKMLEVKNFKEKSVINLFFHVVAVVAPAPAALVCVWCDGFGTIL